MEFKRTPSSATGTSSAANVVAENFQRAVYFHQQGQLAPAQQAYQQVLQIEPNHAHALHLLGVLAFQTSNHSIAVKLIGKAIAKDPSHAAFHCNLGTVLLKQKQPYAAIASYERALDIKPDFADALGNRGVALAELQRFEAAVESYDAAIAANPNYAEAFSNRGAALLKLKRTDDAIASWDAAISLRPDFAEAYCARGVALQEQGNPEEAMTSFQKALGANPNLNAAHCNLAALLMEQGRPNEALAFYIKALSIADSPEGKRGFVQCIKQVSSAGNSPVACALLVRAITEAWTRPTHLLAPALNTLRREAVLQACMGRASDAWPAQLSQDELFGSSGLTAVAGNPMLRTILESIPIASMEMERFLTQTRRVLLFKAMHVAAHSDEDGGDDPVLSLSCALARQCHLNEYVFCASDDELVQVDVLRDRIEANVAAKLPISSFWLATVAAYCPLNSMQSAVRLTHLAWPAPALALVHQQILEPATERAYRPLVRQITPIADGVSLLVQEQYEENPYSRWIRTGSTIQLESIDFYLRQLFPNSPVRQSSANRTADILIAGCGTGQQSIDSALLFPSSRLLAIDLSRSSLCYAKRKTDELGLQNIEYAQADIMALGGIGKTFDLIESVGVLHHLADPLAGWRVLLGLLKPGGFMRLGLYSELARQNIVAAREHIARQGYAATTADIRRCRQDLMSLENRAQFGKVLSFRDFFGMSECRDLIFHVQEHRFNLLQVKDVLREMGLTFIGFNLEANAANRYHERFPEDQSLTNLDSWNLFETENPDLFAGMYQFWVQKIDK
nr:tetratricopeptide repeat protein [uncultured Rhodoferax sp.]